MTIDDPDIPAAASLLHLRNFRLFFAGRLVSLLGSSMAPIALAFAVLNASNGNATDVGAVLTANTVPLIVFTLAGGVAGDRFPRRLVLLASNAGAGVTQGIVAYLLISGHYSLPLLIGLEALNGTLAGFTQPALRGIVPDLVDPPLRQRANSVLGSARSATKILGPTLAATLVATAGGGWAIAIDSATYFVAATALSAMRLSGAIPERTGSPLKDIRDGWTEFRSRSWVWTIVASFSFTNCLQVGIWTVLGPLIARTTIGETAWGVTLSVKAVGILVMSVVMYRIVLRRLLPIGQLCIVLTALPLIALGLQSSVYWLATAALVAGLGSGVYAVAWETSLQEHIPRSMLSRISSYDNLGSFIAIPVGQLSAAPLAAEFGAARVALVGGVLYAIFAVLPLAAPSVRAMQHSE